MDLDTFAEHVISKVPLSCLVYDNRGFGSSDVKGGQPRHVIIPAVQCSDISDAITYVNHGSTSMRIRLESWAAHTAVVMCCGLELWIEESRLF